MAEERVVVVALRVVVVGRDVVVAPEVDMEIDVCALWHPPAAQEYPARQPSDLERLEPWRVDRRGARTYSSHCMQHYWHLGSRHFALQGTACNLLLACRQHSRSRQNRARSTIFHHTSRQFWGSTQLVD